MDQSKLKELLQQITRDLILEAMRKIDSLEVPKNRRSLFYNVRNPENDKVYPPPYLIECAFEIGFKNKLPNDFFSKIGRDSAHFKRLEELGFKIVPKMYKNYIKKASKQDVTKTTVINNDAVKDFFGISVPNKDNEVTIKLKYHGDLDYKDVKIIRKQDTRVFIDRDIFNEEDLLFFSTEDNESFDLEIIKTRDERYANFNSKLKGNYLLANSLDFEVQFEKNQPLNQILYGPPGTGKTYSTITKALNILGLLEEKDFYTAEEYEEAQELFQNELGKRIEFVTMHQSFSYEDFVQGLKPLKSNGSGGVRFDYKNGVFKEICKRAEEYVTGDFSESDLSLSSRDLLKLSFFLSKYNGKKKEEKKANEFLKYDSDNEAFIGIGIKTNEKPNSIKNHRDKFDFMFNNREGYTARKGWKPRNHEGLLDNTDNWPYREIYDELNGKNFEEVSEIIKNLLESKSESKNMSNGNENFVIILDEINRANISRVFGELIALIESDKRDGKLSVTLPSGDSFTVPSNLFIIGTMNTADKSIALVDIALRRRFEFISLYPDMQLLRKVLKERGMNKNKVNHRVYLLDNINKIIRAKKSVDFEIGHAYFMSSENLLSIMNKQILPLLNEYFMYDLKKVKDILEKQQKDRQGKAISSLGISIDQDYWNDRGLLRIVELKMLSEKSQEPDQDLSEK